MIRKIAMLAAATAALAAAPAALAQQQQQQREGVRVGLGLGLNLNQFAQPTDLNFAGIAPVAIYVPVQISPSLRVEPWLGFWTWSENGPVSGYAWDLGAGVLYYFLPAAPFGLYGGGRFGLTFSGGDDIVAGDSHRFTETDFRIMGVLGGEYFVAPKFSLGAEAQLGVTFYGDLNDKNQVTGVTVTASRDRSSWQTNGVLFMRYFF